MITIEQLKDQLKETQENYLLKLNYEELKELCTTLVNWRKQMAECEDDEDKRCIIDGYLAAIKEIEKFLLKTNCN